MAGMAKELVALSVQVLFLSSFFSNDEVVASSYDVNTTYFQKIKIQPKL